MESFEKEAGAGGSQTQSRRETDPGSTWEPLDPVMPKALRSCERIIPFPLGPSVTYNRKS